jgi:hypothetical protein
MGQKQRYKFKSFGKEKFYEPGMSKVWKSWKLGTHCGYDVELDSLPIDLRSTEYLEMNRHRISTDSAPVEH